MGVHTCGCPNHSPLWVFISSVYWGFKPISQLTVATEYWHVWTKREETLQSPVLLLNCLQLFEQYKWSNRETSSVWNIEIIHGLISNFVEGSERSLIYIKYTYFFFIYPDMRYFSRKGMTSVPAKICKHCNDSFGKTLYWVYILCQQ